MESSLEAAFDAPLTDVLLHGFAVQLISPHGALSLSWAFPAAPAPLASVLVARANFTEPIVSRFGGIWHYSSPVRDSQSSQQSAGAQLYRAAAVVVWGARYAPEAGVRLAGALAGAFAAGGTALATDVWLEVLATGVALSPTWAPTPPPPARAAFAPTGARALFTALGVESVLVWTALMARRRVAVLGSSAAETARVARLFVMMVAHRADTTTNATLAPAAAARTRGTPAALLVPYVSLSEQVFCEGAVVNKINLDGALGGDMAGTLKAGWAAQRDDLAGIKCFVAGFTDTRVSQWGGEVWDVLVDVSARTVVVTESAKGE